MSESGGVIYLDLVIKNKISADIKKIVNSEKSVIKSSSDNLSKAMTEPIQSAEKKIEKSFNNIAKVKKTAFGYDKGAMAFIDEYQKKLNSMKSAKAAKKTNNKTISEAPKINTAESEKLAKRMYSEFNVASKPLDLMYDRLNNINAQIDMQRDKLKQACREYANIASAAETDLNAEKRMNGEIEKIRSKIISLQGSANQVTDKIKKETDKAAEAVKSSSANAAEGAKNSMGKAANNAKKSAKQSKAAFKSAGNDIKNSMKSAAAHAKSGFSSLKSKMSNTAKSGNSMFSKLGKTIKGAFKSVMFASVLYAGFKAIKSFVGDAVASNKKFSDSLLQIKNNLAVAFTPILNAVMPVLNTLMSGLAAVTKSIAAFIAGIFGTTYKQAAKATNKLKSVSNQSKKTAKETNDNLQSFDKLNVRQKDTSSSDSSTGSGDGGAVSTDDSGTEKAVGLARDLSAKVKSIFSDLKKWIDTHFSIDFSQIGKNFEAAFGSLKKIAVKTFPGIQSMASSALGASGACLTGIAKTFVKSFNTLSEGIRKFFGNNKQKIINGINTITKNLTSGFNSLKGFFNTVFGVISGSIDRMRGTVSDAISNLLSGFTGFGLSIGGIASEAFAIWTKNLAGWAEDNQGKIGKTFDSFQQLGSDLMNLFGDVFGDIGESLSTWWNDEMAPVWDNICKAALGVADTVMNVWNQWIYPVIQKVISWVHEMWDKNIKPVFDAALSFIAKLGNCIATVWNKFFKPYIDWLIGVLKPVIMNIINAVLGVLSTVVGYISGVIKSILKYLGGLLDFITGIFSGDWKKAWNGIKDMFGGIWDGIWNTVKTVVNLIIDGINLLWTGIYNAVSVIVDGIGGIAGAIGSVFGQDWSFKMPEKAPLIPKLATGGLATAPTLAMVGDNKNAGADPEVIAPLSKLKDYIKSDDTEVLNLINSLIASVNSGTSQIVKAVYELITCLKNKKLIESPEKFARDYETYFEAERNRRGGGTNFGFC